MNIVNMMGFRQMMCLLLLQLWFPALINACYASSSPSVIIIGAGMSGISAAKTLEDAGISDFLILEATPRIGGRIHKVEFAGHWVELGANWLTGVEGRIHNPIFEIAKKLKLKTFLSDYTNVSSNVYKQEGGLYAKEEVDAVMEIADATENFGKNFSRLLRKSDDVSILAMHRLCNKHVPATALEMVIDYYYYDFEDAEPPRVTSLKHTLPRYEYEDYGHTSYFAADPRGIEIIVHHLARKFLSYQRRHRVINDPRLKLNKVVNEIDYSSDGGGVTIKTEDGSAYQAKKVIISVSLGVLQSDLMKFDPKLPEWKERSIQELSMTVYTKIFLNFPNRFWPTGKGTSPFLYAHERRGYYPIWQHLDIEIPGSNILMALATDEESSRIEQQSDEETRREAMDVLRKMFGNHIPEADHILVPRWRSDRFYRGTYANWPYGVTEHRYNQLLEPVVGNIYFTGEHTNPRYMGYMDGAYIAGQRTAKEVLKSLREEDLC